MGKIFRWTLFFVVVVILASGGVAFYTVFFAESDDVTMPLLKDMSVVDAAAEAERFGFSIKVEQAPSTLPAGQVLTQFPEAGAKVRKDKVVILRVSQGGRLRLIPDVRERDLRNAQGLLQAEGFAIGDIVYIKDNARAGGTVIAQSPAAPANVPVDKKVDLLVSQGSDDGRIRIPDVANLREREARDLLTASGLRVGAVDQVYSQHMPSGVATGTNPSVGTAVRQGASVRLNVTTGKRPQEPQTVATTLPGVAGASPSSEKNVSGGNQVVVKIPGREDVVIKDTGRTTTTVTPETSGAVNSNISVFDQQRAQANARSTPVRVPTQQPVQQNRGTTDVEPAAPKAPAATPPALQPTGNKVARIRYQVPPITRQLELRIEMVDPSGKKVLLQRNAKSAEYVSLDAPYSRECAVTIYLGGEFVWQDKYM